MGNTKHYIWSAVDKFGTQIISFVSNILIARILSPDDYGLVAMLAIFTTIVMSLSDAGFNDGLIRKSDCDKKDFGTIASYNLAVALFMFAVMKAIKIQTIVANQYHLFAIVIRSGLYVSDYRIWILGFGIATCCYCNIQYYIVAYHWKMETLFLFLQKTIQRNVCL